MKPETRVAVVFRRPYDAGGTTYAAGECTRLPLLEALTLGQLGIVSLSKRSGGPPADRPSAARGKRGGRRRAAESVR